jgi:hypothetical protein
MLLVLALAVSVAALAACGGTDPGRSADDEADAAQPAAEGSAAAAQPDAEEAAPAEPPVTEAEAPLLRQGHDGQCWPDVGAQPCSAGVPVGSQWTYAVYTHCGVESIYLDGRFWLTEPLGAMAAPAGWGEPLDEGVITLEAPDRAVYLSQGGDQVEFTPAPEDYEPPLCQ